MGAFRAYSPSGVPYSIRFAPEAYQEKFARNQNQISGVLIKCQWDDAGDLKADLMDSAEYVPGQAYLTRNVPFKHPDTDKLFLIDMTKVELFMDSTREPRRLTYSVATQNAGGVPPLGPQTDALGGTAWQYYDEETGFWSMDHIVYNLTFGNLPWPVKTDEEVLSSPTPELERYCVITKVPQLANRRVSSFPFVYDRRGPGDAKLAVNETWAIPETTTRIMCRLCMWPAGEGGGSSGDAINWAAIYAAGGKVNQSAFTIRGETHPAETLRFDGLAGAPEIYHGADGNTYQDFTLVWNRHPENWNKAYDAGAPTPLPPWQYIRVDDDAAEPTRRYLKTDFAALAKPKP